MGINIIRNAKKQFAASRVILMISILIKKTMFVYKYCHNYNASAQIHPKNSSTLQPPQPHLIFHQEIKRANSILQPSSRIFTRFQYQSH